MDPQTGVELRFDQRGSDVEEGHRVRFGHISHREHRPSGELELERRAVVGHSGEMLENLCLEGGIVDRLEDSLLAEIDGTFNAGRRASDVHQVIERTGSAASRRELGLERRRP